MLKKQESVSLPRKYGFRDFWRIANSVLNKGKSAMPALFKGPRVLSFTSDKAKLLVGTLILMMQVFLYPFSLLGLI